MNRFLTEADLQRLKTDFARVLTIIQDSRGEYDLRLRNNYLNLYSRGNSIAKIEPTSGCYKITIHVKFAKDVFSKDNRFSNKGMVDGNYATFALDPKLVRPFFQKTYLQAMSKKVATVDHSEEGEFEQLIIADNWGSKKWIIIDRQVIFPGKRDNRIDLIALKRSEDGEFHFHVVEVKMGNNPELREDVADQLTRYKASIRDNIDAYRSGYITTIKQLWALGLLPQLANDSIQIGDKVDGSVAVFGYRNAADAAIATLKAKHADIDVKYFAFRL